MLPSEVTISTLGAAKQTAEAASNAAPKASFFTLNMELDPKKHSAGECLQQRID
jgi:hypothetical protein